MIDLDKRIITIIEDLGEMVFSGYCRTGNFKIKYCEHDELNGFSQECAPWEDYRQDSNLGGRDRFAWLRQTVSIPAALSGKCVYYKVETERDGQWNALNPQMLVYVNGEIRQALDTNHTGFCLTASGKEGENFDIAFMLHTGMIDDTFRLKAAICALNRDIEALYYDLRVPWETMVLLNTENRNYGYILSSLNSAINVLDWREPDSAGFLASVADARKYLAETIYSGRLPCEDVVCHAVGHTHIDVAWQWRLLHTRHKAVRSFSTAVALMDEYPEYIFSSSQPQLYDYVMHDQPGLYEKIKNKARSGQWDPEGGMWLEADTNLASGESLIRQLLYGKRFFKEQFGKDTRVMWLPDAFGYSAALPQILKKCGVDYFMTTKLSWNEYDRMPHDTFMWQGIDGSEVLTHFGVARDVNSTDPGFRTRYNGDLTPGQLIGAWANYRDKLLDNQFLLSFGFADGGGGPTREMLEFGRRLEKGIPGCPRLKYGTVENFFDGLSERVSESKYLATWTGELYLEFHRATLSSMGITKRRNRLSELKMLELESLLTIASAGGGLEYPKAVLDEIWEIILRNQFHDLLPGTCIGEVYEDSEREYARAFELIDSCRVQALSALCGPSDVPGKTVRIFNMNGFENSGVVSLPDTAAGSCLIAADGSRHTVQKTYDGDAICHVSGIPSKGYADFLLVPVQTEAPDRIAQVDIEKGTFENSDYSIHFNPAGEIISLYDKSARKEVFEGGCGNVLRAFEDRPYDCDSWDTSIYFEEKSWRVEETPSIELLENGPVRTVIRTVKHFASSTITQDMVIYENDLRIDFVTDVDWRQKQILLKAEFPVSVRADHATYGIQFGSISRNNHRNTSWDSAKFEVCAQQWSDLSQYDYGVSILDDCKYGRDTFGSMMRITLIKSGNNPFPQADVGRHRFTYSLYPHKYGWRDANTPRKAMSLNLPMFASRLPVQKDGKLGTFSFISTKSENVMIETLKVSEDGKGAVVRVYECFGGEAKTKLTCAVPIAGAIFCDMLENNIEEAAADENSVEIELKPFEVKTIRILFCQ